MDKKQTPVATQAESYVASLTEFERIGVQVATEVIPHIYCIERCYGFQLWKKKQPQSR
jgi:hypothetical protein